MKKLSPPEGILNHPILPLPWQPSQRLEITNNLFLDNPSRDTREYIRDLQNRYPITGIGVFAVKQAIGYTSVGADVFFGRERTEKDQYEVQREFEQEILGLEPLDNSNGLRFSEHPSGFGGGTYPIEPFAELIGADVDTLQNILDDKQATRFGHIILHFSNFIVPIQKIPRDNRLVSADMVTELSKEGEALLQTALWISDYASRPVDS